MTPPDTALAADHAMTAPAHDPEPKVSVILPVYNRAASLENAMRSVLNQDERDLELIVVDDASTEDLRPIIDAVDDPRVRYVRQPKNGGASVARNTGLDLARGRFIAFQDSDDLWLPGKLAHQLAVLEADPELGVVTGSKVLYGGGADGTYGTSKVSMRPPPAGILTPGEDQVLKFLKGNRISLQNALFRRDCYPSMTWFDPLTRSNADWAFSSSLAQYAKIREEADPVVMAFSSADGISKNFRWKAIGLIRILKRNRDIYARYPVAHATMMFRIGRILTRAGKGRMARRFYVEALRRHPPVVFEALRGKLARWRR